MNTAESIEDRIHILGTRLLEIAGGKDSSTPAWMTSLLSQAMTDPEFRVQALRFVDVHFDNHVRHLETIKARAK